MEHSKEDAGVDKTPPPRPDRKPRVSDGQPASVTVVKKEQPHSANGEDVNRPAAARRGDKEEEEVRDMHGFKLHGKEYIAMYRGWIPLHQKKLAERKARWMELFRKSPGTSYLENKDLKKLVRKGVPDSSRGEVWMDLSGARKLLLANPGVYK
jgi:hypothetical protein